MKNKKQKRKKKLVLKQRVKQISINIANSFYIDKEKIEQVFPDKQKRLKYIKALIIELG